MTKPNLNSRIAKALLETSHYMAGWDVLSKSSWELIENGAEDCDKKMELLLSASRIFNAPMVAKQAITQNLHTYLLLYNLAYEDLTPAQEMRTWMTLRQMALSQEKMLREVAPMLVNLEEVRSRPGSKPREPERKPLTEEARRRLDALFAMLEASRKENDGTAGESTKDGEPSHD